jgi:hypothetical protein
MYLRDYKKILLLKLIRNLVLKISQNILIAFNEFKTEFYLKAFIKSKIFLYFPFESDSKICLTKIEKYFSL